MKMVLCLVWFLQILLSTRSENSPVQQVSVSPPWSFYGSVVWRVSVPEHHHLCLPCSSHVHPTLKNLAVPLKMTYSWTHEGQEVPPKRTQDQDEDQDQWRFNIGPEGALCILRLVSSDSGEYYCNKQLMVDLQVLKGEVYSVRVGGTLLLPCTAFKPRQRWFRRRPGSRRELVMTRSRDGTVTLEREDARLGFEHDAMMIAPLQLEDSGDYQCNGEKLATVIIQTEPNPTSTHPNHSSSSVPPVFEETDFAEKNTKERKSENVLLVVIVCLSLMVVMVTVVSVLLVSVKCRRKRRHRRAAKESPEATELQSWTTTPKPDEKEETTCPTPEEEEDEGIYYASLGRPMWNHRPIQTTPEREHHTVIYSAICTK